MEFPLRVKRGPKSYLIVDARGRSLILPYEDDELRCEMMGRWTRQEAEDLAVYIARMLTSARAEQLYLWDITSPASKGYRSSRLNAGGPVAKKSPARR